MLAAACGMGRMAGASCMITSSDTIEAFPVAELDVVGASESLEDSDASCDQRPNHDPRTDPLGAAAAFWGLVSAFDSGSFVVAPAGVSGAGGCVAGSPAPVGSLSASTCSFAGLSGSGMAGSAADGSGVGATGVPSWGTERPNHPSQPDEVDGRWGFESLRFAICIGGEGPSFAACGVAEASAGTSAVTASGFGAESAGGAALEGLFADSGTDAGSGASEAAGAGGDSSRSMASAGLRGSKRLKSGAADALVVPAVMVSAATTAEAPDLGTLGQDPYQPPRTRPACREGCLGCLGLVVACSCDARSCIWDDTAKDGSRDAACEAGDADDVDEVGSEGVVGSSGCDGCDDVDAVLPWAAIDLPAAAVSELVDGASAGFGRTRFRGLIVAVCWAAC